MSNSADLDSKVAIIAGTGFEAAFGDVDLVRQVSTPYGSITLFLITLNGRQVVVLPRHGREHSAPPHKVNYRGQLWALKEAGVRDIIATAAAGSLRIDRRPGDVVVLSDFIDYRGEVTTFYDDEVRHTDFSTPFSARIRKALLEEIGALQLEAKLSFSTYDEGVYVCVSGPRYETPAEVRLFGRLGGDVVGMTVAPEAILAKELGLDYAAVAVVTNFGTGLTDEVLRHEDVGSQMEKNRSFLLALLRRTALALI